MREYWVRCFSLCVRFVILAALAIGLILAGAAATRFTPTSGLSITAIAPNSGPTDGGQEIVITGDFGVLASPPRVVQVVAGNNHSLALFDNGRVFAWGQNINGQLGDGTNTDRNAPVEVTGLLASRHIVYIAAGNNYSFAVSADGEVFSWGQNANGQLGNGTTTNSNIPTAVDMSGVLAGRRIVQITGGNGHTLAVDDEGSVFGWGFNNAGQLGLGAGAAVTNTTPVSISVFGALPGREIVQVAAGGSHSLALDSDGNVFAWGWNAAGQLGAGNIGNNSNLPIAAVNSGVMAGSDIVMIATGTTHSIALGSDGNIFGWGSNDAGQLGNNSLSSSDVPVAVSATWAQGRVPRMIAAAVNRSFTMMNDGSLYAWGNNAVGQFGNGSSTDSLVPTPTTMTGAFAGRQVRQVVIGNFHTIAIDSQGSVYSWGANWSGQLGTGSAAGSNVPVRLASFENITEHTVSVRLGTAPCVDVEVIDATSISCVTSPHAAGQVDVVINVNDITMTITNGYTYIAETPFISITVEDDTDINITPGAEGGFGWGSSSISVRTNNQNGFRVYLSSSNESTSLAHTVLPASIPTVASVWPATGSLTAATWGFTLDSNPAANTNIWSAMPPLATPAVIVDSNSPNYTPLGEQITVNFGALIGPTQPSGLYRITVVYTVVTN
ncbi:IPT/TIG domain-containing protein [Candidatus Saccharibacteria bacterium]|nr:IPT/TIG domain-containing protein [Candidatus Saccharibacteria bacterium]